MVLTKILTPKWTKSLNEKGPQGVEQQGSDETKN